MAIVLYVVYPKAKGSKEYFLTSPTGKLVNIILLPLLTSRSNTGLLGGGKKLPCLIPEKRSQQALLTLRSRPYWYSSQEHASTPEGHFPPLSKEGPRLPPPTPRDRGMQKNPPWSLHPHSDPTLAPHRPLGNWVSRCRRVAGAPHGLRPGAKRCKHGPPRSGGQHSLPGDPPAGLAGHPMSPNVTD